MSATTPSVGVGIGISLRISQLLNPRFGAFPSPRDVAKYFCNVLATIGAEKLPVRIYLDHELTEKIAPLLKAMGMKFKVIPVPRKEPPYIYFFIDEETGRLVIEICDLDLKKNRYVTRLDLFLDELRVLVVRIRDKAREKKREEELKEVEDKESKTMPKLEELVNMKPEEFLKLINDILNDSNEES